MVSFVETSDGDTHNYCKKTTSCTENRKHKLGAIKKPHLVFDLFEIQKPKLLQLVNDIQPIVGFLGNVIIQQTKKLQLQKGCKRVNLYQVDKPIVRKN